MKSPLSRRKIGTLDWFCLGTISFYQRHISPRKGWRCAHARLHGGDGCSGFARDAIAIHGLCAATPYIKTRFADCKLATQTLHAQRVAEETNSGEEKSEKRGYQEKLSDVCCVDFSWICCADSLLDGSTCEAASCADASCGHGACADASCGEVACGCHSCW